jgi:hypothetical protein
MNANSFSAFHSPYKATLGLRKAFNKKEQWKTGMKEGKAQSCANTVGL